MIHTQIQRWHFGTRYLLYTKGASVQLETFKTPQVYIDGTALIWALWVDEPYRRRGIAARLLDRAEELARSEGHEAVYLDWDGRDTPVAILEYYKRRGYTVTGRSSSGATVLKKILK